MKDNNTNIPETSELSEEFTTPAGGSDNSHIDDLDVLIKGNKRQEEVLEDGLKAWEAGEISVQDMPRILEALLLASRGTDIYLQSAKTKVQKAERKIADLKSDIQMVVAALDESEEKNATLKDLATTDELTGLPNRAGFIQALVKRIQATKESPKNLKTAVVFLDLDGFKELNDHCGHAVGDDALKEVGRRLQAEFSRKGDMVGRLSGDEMVIFIPYDDREISEGVEDAIRQKVYHALEGLFYSNGTNNHPVGASVGVSLVDKSTITESPMEEQVLGIIEKTDKIMYEKKWGLNGKQGQGTPDDNPDAPKYARLAELKAKADIENPLGEPKLAAELTAYDRS